MTDGEKVRAIGREIFKHRQGMARNAFIEHGAAMAEHFRDKLLTLTNNPLAYLETQSEERPKIFLDVVELYKQEIKKHDIHT